MSFEGKPHVFSSPGKKSPGFKVPRGQPRGRGRPRGSSKKTLFRDSSKHAETVQVTLET